MMKNIIRALRLPFLSVSILPFVFGSFITASSYDITKFMLGLICAISTHLGANLINDYSDSKSGVDWQDKKFYGFFGGSKLIQEGVYKEAFYLSASITCFIISFIAVFMLTKLSRNSSIILFYLIIIFLGWSYSHKPLQLSYHKFGELVIFLLFGPVLVMGAYFIQTQIFPDLKSFILSLPFGFLTTAILFANEIPDYNEDRKFGKYNWVSFLGVDKSYILYMVLIGCAFLSIIIAMQLGYLGKVAYISFIFILPALKAAGILRKYFCDKKQLIGSSKLTILTHTFVSIILILDIVL